MPKPKELTDIAEPNQHNVKIGDLIIDIVYFADYRGGEARPPLTFNRIKAISNNGVILEKCLEKKEYYSSSTTCLPGLNRDEINERCESKVDDNYLINHGIYELPFSQCLVLRPDGTYLLRRDFASHRNKKLEERIW